MIRAILLAGAGAFALSACVAGPAPEIGTPVPVLPKTFLYTPDAATTADMASLLPVADPAFDTLVTQALSGSPALGEALARIEAARAGADGAGAQRLPSIGAGATVDATRTNPNQIGSALPPVISIDTERVSYGATLSASWDADLFGQLRARERAALARLDATGADAAAVRLALVSDIAANVIDWRTLSARETALQEDLAAAEQLVRLSRTREEAGLSPGFDRVRAQSAASASRSRISGLQSERARLIGQLVTLTAQSGAQIRAALARTYATDDLPGTPASAPSALLNNRPDIIAAGARLAASDADLYAAAASRFPKLDLSAALGLLSFNLADLFDEDAIIGSLAASIAGPLLDFGRVQAEIDGAAANKQVAFQSYRRAVFTALGDAEGAYALVAAADAEATLTGEERDLADRATRIADTRYRAGLTDFLTVLESRRSADASGERAAAALGRARRARVVLWQALGGDTRPAMQQTAE